MVSHLVHVLRRAKRPEAGVVAEIARGGVAVGRAPDRRWVFEGIVCGLRHIIRGARCCGSVMRAAVRVGVGGRVGEGLDVRFAHGTYAKLAVVVSISRPLKLVLEHVAFFVAVTSPAQADGQRGDNTNYCQSHD